MIPYNFAPSYTVKPVADLNAMKLNLIARATKRIAAISILHGSQ